MLTLTYQANDKIIHRNDAEPLTELLSENVPFWLDMESPTPEELALLADVFHFHPLAIEDVTSNGQRPKVDEYGSYAFFELGAISFSKETLQRVRKGKIQSEEEALTILPVSVFLSEQYLVTIHITPEEHIRKVRDVCKLNERILRRGVGFVLHTLMDVIVDDCFPILDMLEDELDELEDNIIARPNDAHLDEIFFLKREFSRMRRTVAPLRDVLQALMTREFPGIEPDLLPYLRDVDDHVFRIYEMLDAHRDIASNLLDAYLSQKSNELNITMRKMAAISIVFLPLTFITGFFGMNFTPNPWEKTNPFLWLGVMLLVVLGLYFALKSRKWV